MVASAEAAGRDWTLAYGGRTAATMAYAEYLAKKYGPRVTVAPADLHGLLDLDAALGEPYPAAEVYCCGPAPLLDAVRSRCLQWPNVSVRTESFTPATIENDSERACFEVELATTGTVLAVPADRSILDGSTRGRSRRTVLVRGGDVRELRLSAR